MNRRANSLFVLLVCAAATCAEPTEPRAAPVMTDSGPVVGYEQADLQVFKGIPYAEPPVGRLRWRSPKAIKHWQSPLRAQAFGPLCPQPKNPRNAGSSQSEDCLTLNIWTPAQRAAPRPVMVWIHGGGFRSGSGEIPGEVLAREGVVVVSLNYRLGPLGFMAHPALAKGSANFGLEDMVLALQWVAQNISRFGGDPNNVTLFGVSAGGMAVNMLMVSPLARGLFHKAIAQSGYGTWALPRSRQAPQPAPLNMSMGKAESAEQVAQAAIRKITTEKQTRKHIRSLAAKALVNAIKGFQVPIVDGVSLAEEPAILFERGQQAQVPFLSGGNSFEGSVMPASGISETQFANALSADGKAVRELYRDDFEISESQGWQRVFGDNRYLLAAHVLGQNMHQVHSPAYLYYIDYLADAYRQHFPGAPHGGDALLLFGNEQTTVQADLSVPWTLRAYWLNFARSGDPNGPGLPNWPRYERSSRLWLTIDNSGFGAATVIASKLELLEQRYQRRVSGTR